MIKQRVLHGLKIVIIILLVMAIAMLVVIRWKSEIIIEKVMSTVEHELVDTLQYTTADMNWFSHFPLISIHIYDLSIGSANSPLIQNSDIDIVIGLFPLFKNQIIINKLALKDGAIRIHENHDRWSYDVFRKKEKSSKEAYATKIRQLVIENITIQYEDLQSNVIDLAVDKGVFKGSIVDDILETNINLKSTIKALSTSDYSMPAPFQSNINGHYTIHLGSGQQFFKDLQVDHDAIQLSINGTLQKDLIDVDLSWKKANPEVIKAWLPEKLSAKTKAYQVKGVVEGQSKIKGLLSKNKNLSINAVATLKNGSIVFLDSQEEIKGVNVGLSYANGKRVKVQKSSLKIVFQKSGKYGPSFKGEVGIMNLLNPVFDFSFDGSLPSSMLNLLQLPGLHFERGIFTIDKLALHKIQPSKFSINTFFQQGMESVKIKDLHFKYHHNDIKIDKGTLHLADNLVTIEMNKLVWDKASISDMRGSVSSKENKLDYQLSGKLCQGQLATTGVVTGLNQSPVISSSWKVSGIEIDQLLESFSNFDQTFITSENLSGKTNLWVESKLPFDKKWNLLSKQVVVKSAIAIREGRLSGMQAFEEFSKFVHLEDLRDIRFNQIRNYMLIEKGKVHLPVMFIQSSALNLSISGAHGFDEQIIYFLKLNAGQIAGKKLKKNQKKKDYVKASKSGWINMYFALSGSTKNVKYQQYKKAVIAGFEQSTVIKDKLRDELVEQFGYDVYWLEPNEWEDIPEYQ